MTVGIYLLKSVAVLSIFYGVYFVFLRKETLFQTKRHFFIAGILAALIIPFLEFTKTVLVEIPVIEAISVVDEMIPANLNLQPIEAESAFPYWQLAIGVYLIGLVVMGVHFMRQLFSLLKLIRRYPSKRLGSYTFVQVNENVAPFSFFRYIVYNPRSHSEEELEMILKHEKVHASQWHSVDIIFGNLLRMLQWANPFSWLYKRSLEENLEFIADSETVNQVTSSKEYQLTLVKASSPLLAPALTTQFYQSFIKKRIIMLNKRTSKKHNIWKATLVLPLLALFLWSFNVQEVVEYQEVPPTKSATAIESPSELPGEPLVAMEETPETIPAPAAIELAPDPMVSSEEEDGANAFVVEDPAPVVANAAPLNVKFKFHITKNTTDAELDEMKSVLKKEHNIDMSYTVVRNSSGEITSINLSYTGDGSSGSYNIEDDKPIEDFHFYRDEERSGFYSASREKRHLERMEARARDLERRNEEREMRLAKRMYQRSKEMEERRREVERVQDEVEDREVIIEQRSSDLAERKRDMERAMKERNRAMKERNREIKRRNKEIIRASKGSGNNAFVYSDDYDFQFGFDDVVVIDKNTSDAELEEIKRELADRGVTFNYSKVKRNGQGEIVRIKITSDDGKGNRSTVISDGDDETIDRIIIKN